MMESATLQQEQLQLLRQPSQALAHTGTMRERAQKALNHLRWPDKKLPSWRLALPDRLPTRWDKESLGLGANAPTSPSWPHHITWQAQEGIWRQVVPEGQLAPKLQPAYIGSIAEFPNALKLAPGSYVPEHDQLLWAANGAHCPDVLLVVVPAHTQLTHPVDLCWQQTPSPQCALPRVHVVLEEGAKATLITRHGEGEQWMLQGIMECHLGPGASLEHIELSCPSTPNSHRLTFNSYLLGQDAQLKWTGLLAGGHLHRHDCHVLLQGEGSQVDLGAVLLGQDHQSVQLHTHIAHQRPHTFSQQRIHGLISQQARGLYRGHVQVMPGADHTHAQQRSRNLLIDPSATMITEPQLTIDTDQVRCSHGATVAGIDPEQWFYLQSRGLAPALAKQWLISAFAQEALQERHPPSLQTLLDEQLQVWLAPVPSLARMGVPSC